ncbi:MAG: 30S ribosomal protein S20 [Deltaproteobacteria bacterium]|nr:30S ribosomal protein S20 [Deltaproteobacteria bacterium]
MANHPQAEKRNRQRIDRQTLNRHFRATMRTYIKRVRAAVDAADKGAAGEALSTAIKMLDRCAQKGIIPKPRAARHVSRLTKAVNAL